MADIDTVVRRRQQRGRVVAAEIESIT